MRTNLLSVIIGGLLVAGGYVLGATNGVRSSDAGVALDPDSNLVVTSGEYNTVLTIWRRDGDNVTGATRYHLQNIDDEQRIVRTVHLPEESPTEK